MDYFSYRQGRLFCEDVPVDELASKYSTPCYIYSVRTMLEHYRKIQQAFAPNVSSSICYSVKANPNLSILKLMQNEGAGFDVVSGGELFRVLKIGAMPSRIVFAGVGKTDEEIRYGLKNNILLFNVESEQELENINRIAKEEKKIATVALRVNPDVDPHTHTYITTGKKENKFGIDFEKARQVLSRINGLNNIELSGLHIHIGSQIVEVEPYIRSVEKLVAFLPECKRYSCKIDYINIGGGFGIFYKEKLAKTAKEIGDALLPLIIETGCKLLLEPGRFIVGNAGILVTKVLYVKDSGDKKFFICDAGMNDLIRPTLYSAYHKIWPINTNEAYSGEAPDGDRWNGRTVFADIVGPICETGDFFARERRMPTVKRGELLAVFSAGAYGYAMSSNYNSHPRSCEIMVSAKDAELVTERENYNDLIAKEKIVNFDI